jgi:hypothetical protein
MQLKAPDGESVQAVRTWASLSRTANSNWDSVSNIIRAAEADSAQQELELRRLLNESDARLEAVCLCDPLHAGLGLNRWLRKEREEAYSDWLEWVLQQVQALPRGAWHVLWVLGVPEKEIPVAADGTSFEISREFCIPDRRLDLFFSLEGALAVVVEVKKYSAEVSQTEKQAPYFEWLHKQDCSWKRAILLVTDAAEETSYNFARLRWRELCSRLRALLPAIAERCGLVKAAMVVAFIGAAETNLLGLVAPDERQDCNVDHLSYGETIRHLKRCMELL